MAALARVWSRGRSPMYNFTSGNRQQAIFFSFVYLLSYQIDMERTQSFKLDTTQETESIRFWARITYRWPPWIIFPTCTYCPILVCPYSGLNYYYVAVSALPTTVFQDSTTKSNIQKTVVEQLDRWPSESKFISFMNLKLLLSLNTTHLLLNFESWCLSEVRKKRISTASASGNR